MKMSTILERSDPEDLERLQNRIQQIVTDDLERRGYRAIPSEPPEDLLLSMLEVRRSARNPDAKREYMRTLYKTVYRHFHSD